MMSAASFDDRGNYMDIPQRSISGLGIAPFALAHGLAGSSLFDLERLARFTERLQPSDYFISVPATNFDSPFYGDSAPGSLCPGDVIRSLEESHYKLLVKRPEKYDAEFKKLLESGLNQVLRAKGESVDDVIRCESGIFITGFKSITPYHFDPEDAMFMQVIGKKTYHVYHPSVLAEQSLESHYSRLRVDIGDVTWHDSATDQELLLELTPGRGLHQPANAPHWVETSDSLSVSYAFGYETKQMRATARTYAYNHLLRKVGFAPAAVGGNPTMDRSKSLAMLAIRPLLEARWEVKRQAKRLVREHLRKA
jgi:hypothetical protein